MAMLCADHAEWVVTGVAGEDPAFTCCSPTVQLEPFCLYTVVVEILEVLRRLHADSHRVTTKFSSILQL